MKTRSLMFAAIASATVVASSSLAQAQPVTRTVWDGVYTAAQADRGKAQFLTNCARCHGDSLQGQDVAPALVGGAFLTNWSGQMVGDLVDRIRTTMPADDPGKIGAAAAADIVSFILASNQMAAGSTELPRDAQLQKNIRIDALKPAAMNVLPGAKPATVTAAKAAPQPVPVKVAANSVTKKTVKKK